ncbi:MAG: hypothetical protein WCQ99_02370 [Pseudomonadota bacterium]
MIGLILWLCCGLIAATIGSKKNEGGSALLFGLLLGPIGILLAILSSGYKPICPFCKETIKNNATVCKHCKKDLPEIKGIKPKTSAVRWVVTCFFALIVFSFIASYLIKKPPTDNMKTGALNQTTVAPEKLEKSALKKNTEKFITINGKDKSTGTIIQNINLWNDYMDRSKGVSCTLNNGDKAILLDKTTKAAFIKNKDGKTGWCALSFIIE